MNPINTTNKIASTNPVQNITTQGTVTPAGIVNYDPNTGAKLAKGQSVIVNQGGNTYGSTPYATQSTTTLSSDKTTDILNNNNKLTTLSTKGVTTDPKTGIATTADGSVYNPPVTYVDQNFADTHDMTSPAYANYRVKTATPEDPYSTQVEDDQIDKNFAEMKANTDAVTAAEIASIQERYKRLKQQQAKINESTLGATTNALIQSGAAKHDVFSDDNIKLRLEQNADKIKDLEAEENDLINAAKAAQLANNNKILELKNAQIEKVREAKQAAAKKINDDLIEANKKAREAMMQASRNFAVADLFAQGITDPKQMLDFLNFDEQGNQIGDFTAKEIQDTLKSLENNVPGVNDLVKTLATNGAPQEVIQKVLNSRNINEAYANAGGFAAGGTGIIGEYNFYKAQAEAKGQVPVDFNTYQDMDANRKKSIARAGVSNTTGASGTVYNPQQEKVISKVETSVSKSPAYTKTVSMQTYKNNVEASLSQGTGVGDIAAINQFQKVIDEGAVTRDQDVTLIQSSQSLANTLKTKIKKLERGEQLSPELRQQMLTAVTDIYAAQQKAIANDPFIKAKKNELVRNNIDPTDTIFGELESLSGSTSDDLIQTEDQAKTTILDYGKTNPTAQTQIRQMVKDGVPYLTIKQVLNIP